MKFQKQHHHSAFVSDSYLCLWSRRTSNQMLQRITPHASAMAKAHGILGTLFERGEKVLRVKKTLNVLINIKFCGSNLLELHKRNYVQNKI